MSETYTGGDTGTFWLVVSYDDESALVVTELQEAPQWWAIPQAPTSWPAGRGERI